MSQDGWTKPLAKFDRQVKVGANMRMGMAMNVLAFNVYIVPLLEYVAQLLTVDDKVDKSIQKAIGS